MLVGWGKGICDMQAGLITAGMVVQPAIE